VNVQSYFGADWTDDDNEATKIEKSITRLENTLSTFPADTVFVIDIRAARNANGTSIIGPFQFTTAEQPAPEQPQQQTQQLGLSPSGYVPESMLKGLEEQLTNNFQRQFDALKAEHQQQQREIEFNNRLERLEEREKEVKELEKSYKSDVAKGADVVVEIVKKIGAYFLMPKGEAQQIISQQQLGAMQQQQQPQQDPKETKVDEICTMLYNNYSIEELNEIQKKLQNGNMGEQNTAATTSSTATAI
ncbi:MAG: hypothetical protein U0L34_07785, partial [Paludibacteraceae bacterium]|nr:hypothetical protein [Paludibacteraceae bacterium]